MTATFNQLLLQHLRRYVLTMAITTIVVSSLKSANNSSDPKMYGIQISPSSRELYANLNEDQHFIIEVFGENVSAVEKVFYSLTPDCLEENVPAKILGNSYFPVNGSFFFRAKPIDPEKFEEVVPYYFFCTRPMSVGYNSMVRVEVERNFHYIPLFVVVLVLCLCMSAAFSGLNLAIFSFGVEELMLIEEYDADQKKRERATNVLSIRKRGNFVLCTIIAGNVMCNTVTTLILNRFAAWGHYDELSSVEVTSSALQLVFTEIIPAVICTKNALSVASRLSLLVSFFMVLTSPITWPLSKVLDWLLGKDDTSKDCAEMEVLGEQTPGTDDNMRDLVNVVKNTMKLASKTAADIMTSIEKVSMVSDQDKMTPELKKKMFVRNHTRVPVYAGNDPNNIRGVLKFQDFLLLGDTSRLTAGTIVDLWSHKIKFVLDSMPVPLLMTEMMGGSPMGIVVKFAPVKTLEKPVWDSPAYHVIGIVTLEDNVEEVVGEILDEKDVGHINQPNAAVRLTTTHAKSLRIAENGDVTPLLRNVEGGVQNPKHCHPDYHPNHADVRRQLHPAAELAAVAATKKAPVKGSGC